MTTLDKRYGPVRIDDEDDVGSNRSHNTPLIELARTRLSRRAAMKGFATTAAVGIAGCSMTSKIAMEAVGSDPSTLSFVPLDQVIMDGHQVAPGYDADILIRWGDKVLADAPEWDPSAQTGAAQAKQFGYNCDFLAYFPLPKGSDNSDHGLLHANHEYTDAQLMFPGWLGEGEDWKAQIAAGKDGQTAEQSLVEMMAHNGTVVEVKKEGGKWQVVEGSQYARRITPATEMAISGPAAGHDRMKTNADSTGTRVFGTINNCAGGKTPWGTVLMAEENFHGYFGGADPSTLPEARNYQRYGLKEKGRYPWYKTVDRFNLSKEPNEPNRFGWIVEYDPYDPNSMPVKRTALGRFKHEGATSIVNGDGRVVLYCGDDERFDYLYRFVTTAAYDPADPAAARDMLDDGVLSVARFDEDSCTWLPLIYGEGPLTPENDFHSQADVLIETRRAADLLGATPMDRPEDVEPNPANGRVYVMLTNNSKRTEEQVDAVNPRAENRHGQVVELIPPGGDHAADSFAWDFLLIAGDPSDPESGAEYHPETQAWLSSPDNCAFDVDGRIWIATDQGSKQRKNAIPDGIYACDLEGDGRGYVKFFFACPRDAEMCGPEFTPDSTTLFVAVQHPGEGDDSFFESPSTRWPDFADAVPPRPAIVAITKQGGGRIGT